MPDKSVFLSSTARDLKEYREAAYRAIEGLDGYHCVRMEDFGARDWDADEFCRAKVGECDLFVGIVGHVYGSCPEGSDQSYTEREYEAALDAGIPRLMFVAPRDFPVPADLIESDEKRKKQQSFRERIRRIRADFKSPDNLAFRVTQAIRNEEYKSPEIERRATRVPFQAPPLPEHFIPRPEKSEEVKRRLLTNISDRPGVLVVSALHGLGGIGKTVLAASLSYDEDIVKYFPDGVLWATLGKEPDLLSLLSGWIQFLGDHESHPTTSVNASIHLRTLLHNKSCLLVVDDAWDSSDVGPFLVGGPNCKILITTRRASVADKVGAELYELDLMTEEQSLDLFSARLGRRLEKTERSDALKVAQSVGYLPLALEIAAARIKKGIYWGRLHRDLKREITLLEGRRPSRMGQTRLEATLNLSFKALYSDDEDAWWGFVWLGILPEDVRITAQMASTLWNIEVDEADELLEMLWGEALLLRDSRTQGQEDAYKGYRIHDIFMNLQAIS